MFHGNIFIAHIFGDNTGFVDGFSGFARKHDFSSGHFGKALEFLVQYLMDEVGVHVQFFQNEGKHIFIHLANGFEQVFVFYLLMPKFLGQLLGPLNGFLRFYGKIVKVHRFRFTD